MGTDEALLFVVIGNRTLDDGTLVEVMGYGLPDPEDDEENTRQPAIRAQAIHRGDDGEIWWYFYPQDLRPLTTAATDLFNNYLEAHRRWEKKWLTSTKR